MVIAFYKYRICNGDRVYKLHRSCETILVECGVSLCQPNLQIGDRAKIKNKNSNYTQSQWLSIAPD
jgi:hypothetical protein